MKKIALGILVAVTILTVSGVVVALARSAPAVDKVNEKAKAPDLEKIEFIHWKKGFAKPTCNNNDVCDANENWKSCPNDCSKPGNGEEEEPAPGPTCYAFMGQYGKRYLQWRELPVSYVINPKNSQSLDATFVTSAISISAETWDAATSEELMNNSYTVDYTATARVQDYENAIAFGDYPTAGVIAVATVWYNPATKTIVEFDVMFDTDWTWGDAMEDATVMDLQNIAVHELGHGVGLADVYETECSAVTMYGYSDYGETQKRTLEAPDITGIQTLYGE